MERYVYVLNNDKYSNEDIDLSFANKHTAFPNTAFSKASVNPIIKSTNITAEHNGVSANFFEIRNGPYDGAISSDNSAKMVNRIYPSNNAYATNIGAYAKNRQQTRSNKIRSYSSKTTETHNQKLMGSGGMEVDLDLNDYFVLINPEIDHTETDGTTNLDTHPSIRPHFAKITQVISYDEYGDGFEFEPKYVGPIPRDANFEIFKGPLVGDTSVVAVSYGLRGDGNEINPNHSNFNFITDKYDASNQVSRPTWYFYNDRLTNENQLDYDNKYNLTTCRWWDAYTVNGGTATSIATTYGSTLTITQSNPSWIIGQSLFRNDTKAHIGNVASISGNTITLDYIRNDMPVDGGGLPVSVSLSTGRTIHQSVFRTEREYGDTIQDLGPKNQHATLVDKMHDNDTNKIDYELIGENTSTYTFNPSIWKDAFRNHKRTTNDLKSSASGYTTAGQISTLTANLTGPKRYMYYKSSHLKNNAVSPITELRVNNPKEKISQIASVKTLDGSGIQFLKLKEDASMVVKNSLHMNTLKEFKLPYTANSNYNSSGPVFSIVLNDIPDKEVDYGKSTVLKDDDIIRVKDTYYRISSVSTPTNNTQSIIVTYKKLASDSTWTQMSQQSHLETFTKENVYMMPWNGGLNSNCPMDTEAIYNSNTLQRLTMHGNTISIEDNDLYNRKLTLLNPEFYGHDIDINYGDSSHNHIKLKTSKKFYQPTPIDFMYYYNGNYCIEDEPFNGSIEDIESSSTSGILTYTITGRDKTSILLSNITSKDLNKTDDIIYSTMAPVFDAPTVKFTPSNDTNPIEFSYSTDNNAYISTEMTKYDLLLNDSGQLLGEVDTIQGGATTIVTLKGFTNHAVPEDEANSIWLVKRGDVNYLTGVKAMAANLKANNYPTEYSSIGENGLVFHDGEKITYSGSFSYSDLLNTSSTDSFEANRTIGYDISDVKNIAESYDSNFAFKLSNEKVADIDYKAIQTVAMSHYNIVDVINQSDDTTALKIAPTFPVVLGSIHTNTEDTTNWGTDMRYLYMVNSNIPNGGFIHTLADTHSDYFSPNNTFRYWGMQHFKEGSIRETFDSIYNNNKKSQRITAATPMYKIDALGNKTTPAASIEASKLTPLRESNLWTKTHLGLTDREAPIEYYSGSPKSVTWDQLENIDYRTKTHELFSIGDIYPDSKLRWNNIQNQTKEFSTYGMMVESEGTKGNPITHEDFTGTTNNTTTSDSNYTRIELSSSPTKTNETKRFGVMRLIEATYDWHFNPVDFESMPPTTDLERLSHFKYPRTKILYPTVVINAVNLPNSITFDTQIQGVIGDLVYRADGTILGQIDDTINTAQPDVGSELILYGSDPVVNEKVYVVRPKLFNMYADKDWGIDVQDTMEGIRMPNMFLAIPYLQRDYLQHRLLIHTSSDYDGHNLWIPLISDADWPDLNTSTFNDYWSAFHESYDWTDTSSEIYYHPSRIINAICENTFSAQEDLDQYKIDMRAHLYDNCHVIFKDFKRATKYNYDNTLPEKPVSSFIKFQQYYGDYTGPNEWFKNNFPSGTSVDQHSRTLRINVKSGQNNYHDLAILGTKTDRHFLAGDEQRAGGDTSENWGTRRSTHQHSNYTGKRKGDIFQAQAFFKPKINLPSHNSSTITITLDENCINSWVDFVPELTGHYLVSDLTTTDDTYLPSKEYMATSDTHVLYGEPEFVARIKEHSVNTNGTYAVHTIKLDRTLTTGTHGKTFRLMRISETTFEDTPDYFETNKMFNIGLDSKSIYQSYLTGFLHEEVSDPQILDAGDPFSNDQYDAITNKDLIYHEGLFAMYLLLDIDHINSHLDRRTVTAATALFDDGDSLNCWVTDGSNSVEKNLIVTSSANTLKFSYDGKLTGYGVVSFGEIITVESPSTMGNMFPKQGYIGTTFSIGTEAEKAIEEILEENSIEVDTSERNLNYTGNIVNANTTSTSIALELESQKVLEGDIIYNQDGKLIGKVTSDPTGNSALVVSNIFYKPKKNDEITKYDRQPHIINTRFKDQDLFSAINFLAAKKSLDYNFDGNKIKIRNLNNYSPHRKFSLKYRDGANLISVDSNNSLFDKANKITVIGDNVKAVVEVPEKKTRTLKHIDPNIRNSQEARIKAYALLELHNKASRKITLTLEKTGFELMKAGDLISLDFPNHNIPPDDYMIFEIENVMASVAKITVGTFNKSIAERLSELGINQSIGFTNLFTKNAKVLTGKAILDQFMPKEKSLKYEVKSTEGGSTFGFV